MFISQAGKRCRLPSTPSISRVSRGSTNHLPLVPCSPAGLTAGHGAEESGHHGSHVLQPRGFSQRVAAPGLRHGRVSPHILFLLKSVPSCTQDLGATLCQPWVGVFSVPAALPPRAGLACVVTGERAQELRREPQPGPWRNVGPGTPRPSLSHLFPAQLYREDQGDLSRGWVFFPCLLCRPRTARRRPAYQCEG